MVVSQEHESPIVGEAVNCEGGGGDTDAAKRLDGVDVELGDFEIGHCGGCIWVVVSSGG